MKECCEKWRSKELSNIFETIYTKKEVYCIKITHCPECGSKLEKKECDSISPYMTGKLGEITTTEDLIKKIEIINEFARKISEIKIVKPKKELPEKLEYFPVSSNEESILRLKINELIDYLKEL